MSKKIVIDPGHGGDDSGAIGNGIVEKEYTLKISQYIAERLKELGAEVYITRNNDETLNPVDRTNRVLNAFGNSKDVLVISNHINAGGGDGAEVIYALRSNDILPNLILNNLQKEGQNIRKAYQRRLPSDPTKDYYFMLRNTGNTEALIIEYGFLDSNKDDVMQLKNNWKKYAEAVVKSIADYLNLDYKNLDKNDNYYIVQSGDSLWGIAKKYNTTIDKIKNANNLNNNLLKINQKLIIPNNNIYIVKAGDTLYSIASKNGTTINELMKINNLTSNIISIGQKLNLPLVNNNFIAYIVNKGDTLYGIAQEYGIDVDLIKDLNNLNTDILFIGQILKIPVSK